MHKKRLTLSIVIPAYNEERHLGACLEAIAAQTVPPDEVIVVDNNSTDRTAEIAKSFPFVRLLHEKKQGKVFARNRGFNAARSDIIGRIDADSAPALDWVARVAADFQERTVGGVTGPGKTVTLPRMKWPRTTLWSWDYFWAARVVFGVPVLWGANTAVRRTAWDHVKDQVCLDESRVHEDTDLSLLLIGDGFRLLQDKHVLISSSGQSYHYWPKLYEYTKRSFSTKKYHQKRGTLKGVKLQRYGFGPIVRGLLLALLLTPPLYLSSLLLWPVDELVLKLGMPRDWWLD